MTDLTALSAPPSDPILRAFGDSERASAHLTLAMHSRNEHRDDVAGAHLEAAHGAAMRLLADVREAIAARGPDDEPTDEPSDEPATTPALCSVAFCVSPATGNTLCDFHARQWPSAPARVGPMTESELRAAYGDR